MFVYTCRQQIASLILSSQISTDSQDRLFLEGETIQLTFSIGKVGSNTHKRTVKCPYRSNSSLSLDPPLFNIHTFNSVQPSILLATTIRSPLNL